MSGAKRLAAAPTAVAGLEPILMSIVQCLASPQDVLAFLHGLDTPSLCTPLAALLQLLRAPRWAISTYPSSDDYCLSYLWPCLSLDDVQPAAAAVVVDAMPMFPKMEVDDVGKWMREWTFVPPGRLPSDGRFDAFAWLAATWGHKLTLIGIGDEVDDDGRAIEPTLDLPVLCSALKLCKGLNEVSVLSDNLIVPDIFAAVTTPAHHVRRVRVHSSLPETDCAAALQPWLASGHAEHLDFSYFNEAEEVNGSVCLLLAAAHTLTSLHLVLDPTPPLDDVDGPWLENLSELRITSYRAEQRFIERLLHSTRLMSLSISASFDFGVVLDVLPRFPALYELNLASCAFDAINVAPGTWQGTPALRSVGIGDAQWFSDAALDALMALLAGAPALETVSLSECEWSDRQFDVVASSLRNCIDRGVRHISVMSCFYLDLSDNHDIDTAGKYALLDALATCAGVSVQLDSHLAPSSTEAAARNLMVLVKNPYFVVASPACDASAV
ncbi:hypothetical protein SPRG_10491 [Saprolegnia parasitica CBS 223.65]|uniref:F-box domain-containing protein n=1 Tax=Saprolegnia parasitica (strain CBS 223.65) TaxID=695850 RepID=A0A067BZN4_SAPPC|nr:hypothetical protein SPRG_10491 [Saprolegnia parasitica CBS 223.65]KDO23713.1 hypothetical protein SPRG_10491 [Saprolegnia parasitica CBS 223.65]|eukprot:XP_012205531.1 hypothetical protein SPRG_10491 [Saprolegnia parasitica CBS 223.65]